MTTKSKKFYVTTPIYYVNDVPHVGTAYCIVCSDIIARWHRLLGDDVFFLTGLDENSVKTYKAAKKFGKETRADIQKYTDQMAKKWQEVWKKLKIEYDGFIRTSEPRHKKVVLQFFNKVSKKGDIYKGKYKGLYCEGCEAFITEKELVNGLCPFHKKKPVKLEEENYFFNLKKYRNRILKYIEKNKNFIRPESKRKEVISFLKSGLKNISISRPDYGWGINLPSDKNQVFWVWFDALLNYISGSRDWPADLHIIGKDILRFHAVIWPAMLFSAEYKMPREIFAHGFLTVNGQKISKSLGNAISPSYLVEKYCADSVRYYFCRNFVFGEDGDFSEKVLVERNNNELANKFGNLVSRVTGLAEKIGLEKTENKLIKKLKLEKIEKNFESYKFDKALNEIFAFIDICNEYVQKNKLWESHDKKRLYELVDSIKAITILLWPVIPSASEKIAKNLGFEINLKNLKKSLNIRKVKKSEILFKKIKYKNI